METSFITAFGIVAVFLLIAGIWRFASRRQSLPCPVWLRWLVELDNPFTKTNRAATIISHLQLEPGMSVADIGCGPGRLAIPAARCVGPVGMLTAVDIQPGMLRIVEEKAKKHGLENIECLEAAAGEGKLGDNRFDRALLVTVLGEIPDRSKAMHEIFASLKPGGILSVTEIIFDPHFQRRQTVEKLTQAAGFKVREFYGNKIAYTLNLVKE